MMPTDIASDPNVSTPGFSATDPTRWTVIYDGDCGFCRWSLAQLLRLDRAHRLRPLALQTQAADELLSDLEPEQRAASWHLVSPARQRWSAGAATPPLLRLLPAGRAPAALLASMPGLTERGYHWVADHRSQLGRLIPSAARRQADDLIERLKTR